MSLMLEHVGYRFGGQPVLDGLSLELEEGEWLSVIGANGSGRSTLAEIASGLRKPQQGHVRFKGTDLWGHSHGEKARAIRRHLGLVMQRAEDQFLGDTVYDDVAFGPRQTTESEDIVEDAVRRALELVDFELGGVREKSPLEFSGGQRRRLAVAGILALNPSVLIMDEPFAGLDCEARTDMVDLILRLRERRQMTVLTLTSDLEFVGDASQLALLVHGAIGLSGDIGDFVANQRLCREAGIVMPETIRLALELRERGWTVPVLAHPGALEAAIAREWRERKHA